MLWCVAVKRTKKKAKKKAVANISLCDIDANAWNAGMLECGMPECYDSAVLSVSKPGKPVSQISEK